MLTDDNALWCLAALLALLAAWGVMWWLGRERPADHLHRSWRRPASDLDTLDDRYADIQRTFPEQAGDPRWSK